MFVTEEEVRFSPDTIRSEWGSYLRGFEWDYFVTLTTNLPTSGQAIRRGFEKHYLPKLEAAADGPVSWFVACERGLDGRGHAHALVWANGKLPPEIVAKAWKIGRAQALPYDATKNATYYVTKDLHRDWAVFEVSTELPPTRRG